MNLLLLLIALNGSALAASPKAPTDARGPSASKPFASRQKDEPSLQEQFDAAVKAMNRAYYTKALETFNKIRVYHRDDPLSVESELAIADVYFKKGDWDQARLGYEDFARMHPHYRRLDYVFYRMGLCLTKKAPKPPGRDQTFTVQAMDTWRNFKDIFPESEYVPEVEEFLLEGRERLAKRELGIARFYERRGAWPAVDARLVGLARLYADTSILPDAMTLLDRALKEQAEQKPERRAEVLAELGKTATRLQASSLPSEKAGGDALANELTRLQMSAP